MEKLVVWCVFAGLFTGITVVNPRNIPEEGSYLTDPDIARIVGGVFVKPNQLPYQVRVRIHANGSVWNCGGAIISRRHVVTANHCIRKVNLEKIDVVAGVVDITSKSRIIINVTDRFLYNKRPAEEIANDVALLKVETPFPVGLKNVKAVKLQEKIGHMTSKCMVSGWGDTFDDLDEDMLKVIHIPLTNKKTCDDIYGLRDDVICAGWLRQGGKDSCKGDSGGPLVCDGLLTGITKGGKGCAQPNFPGTYSEIAYYAPWIKKILANDHECYSDGDIQYYGEQERRRNNRTCPNNPQVFQVRHALDQKKRKLRLINYL